MTVTHDRYNLHLGVASLSPPALWFDLFKPRGGLETAFHNYRDARR